ncbi:hypothetical protein KI387_044600, partial [Taxus chinensis]
MLQEGFEVHIEDVELEKFVLPHLRKKVRKTPSASDESSSCGDRRVIGVHLNPPSDQTMALGFLAQGRSIADPIGISGSNRSTPMRYDFSFPTSMAIHTIPIFGGIFGQGENIQGLGNMLGSGAGHTSSSSTISQMIDT